MHKLLISPNRLGESHSGEARYFIKMQKCAIPLHQRSAERTELTGRWTTDNSICITGSRGHRRNLISADGLTRLKKSCLLFFSHQLICNLGIFDVNLLNTVRFMFIWISATFHVFVNSAGKQKLMVNLINFLTASTRLVLFIIFTFDVVKT